MNAFIDIDFDIFTESNSEKKGVLSNCKLLKNNHKAHYEWFYQPLTVHAR